jgi:hypothetical protein
MMNLNLVAMRFDSWRGVEAAERREDEGFYVAGNFYAAQHVVGGMVAFYDWLREGTTHKLVGVRVYYAAPLQQLIPHRDHIREAIHHRDVPLIGHLPQAYISGDEQDYAYCVIGRSKEGEIALAVGVDLEYPSLTPDEMGQLRAMLAPGPYR